MANPSPQYYRIILEQLGVIQQDSDPRRRWEDDIIKGADNASAIGIVVECKSRYILLARNPAVSARCGKDNLSKKV
jgi:hypothetical protein